MQLSTFVTYTWLLNDQTHTYLCHSATSFSRLHFLAS
jgi:hypothetical protein